MIKPGSTLTVEEFMQRALHDPRHGYYARHIGAIGRRGDFTTVPMMFNSLAHAIATWAACALQQSRCRNLIEIGPGEGILAAEVLRKLPWHIRWKTRLHLVETSSPLTQIQQKRLGHRATWHTSPADALNACNGKAVIFSNELVDAFPVRCFEKSTNNWQEIAVTFGTNGEVRESLLSPSELPPSSSFSHGHAAGQRIEVHDSYRRWLADWLPLWRAGRMLTIDYGSSRNALYHRRPHGTLRAYFMQQCIQGLSIYQNPGRQDLTADVNFTDLIEWSLPWTTDHRLNTLAEFLRERMSTADSCLTDKDGPGEAFMVLDQGCRL